MREGPTSAAAQRQIETILASRSFVNAERLARFLRFVSAKALDGQRVQIKESVIGVEVFGRPATTFDPGADPIVRVQARRLRGKLAEYYQGDGANDAIVVEVPLGHYVPSFRLREHRRLTDLAPAETAIAVLPFLNMSSDPENEYFSDGLTEELIHFLTSVPALRVVARTSTFRFKGGGHDVVEIGQTLGVGRIIEGSVRKVEDKLRITVQLIDVASGGHLWSGRYDRTVHDVFALQDEIAGAVREALAPRLTNSVQPAPPRRATESIEAFGHYLKGRFQWNKRSERGLRSAIEHFGEAIRTDPGYGRAYSGLADCHLMLGMSAAEAPMDSMPLARQAALEALAIDPELAEAHTSLAAVLANFDWDWTGAEREFDEAQRLDPGYPTLHHWRGLFLLANQRRFDEAIAALQRAAELDPISLPINLDLAIVYIMAGRYDEAVRQCAAVLDLDPEYDRAHWFAGVAMAEDGQFDAAVEEIEKAHRGKSGGTAFQFRILGALGNALAGGGRMDEAQTLLAEMQALSKTRYVDKFEVASIYAGLGQIGEAIAELERAAEERSCHLASLASWPGFDRVRADPQCKGLLSRLSLDGIPGP